MSAVRLHVWRLLDRGLYPVPVHPETKAALVPWGAADACGYRPGVGERLGYPALVFEWWDRWPAAGVAVLTGLSGLLVLDVDPRNGGGKSLRRLTERLGLPATLAVRTRRGGCHLYYRTSRLARSGPLPGFGGIDVKSARGYVVAPPTPGYAFIDSQPAAIAGAPRALLALARPRRRARRARAASRPFDDPGVQALVDRACQRIEQAPGGDRHTTIYKQSFAVGCATGDPRAAEALRAAAMRSKPHRPREVDRTIADALRAARGKETR